MVVDDDLCGDIGLNIMSKNNGNSVDAVVATVICLTVTRPDIASKHLTMLFFIYTF